MINGALVVGTEAVQVPVGAADQPVLVNTGETTLYIGNTDGVSTANGIKLASGIGYEFPNTLEFARWGEVWVISDAADGELRYASVG